VQVSSKVSSSQLWGSRVLGMRLIAEYLQTLKISSVYHTQRYCCEIPPHDILKAVEPNSVNFQAVYTFILISMVFNK
jgi:hypothetical protein